MPVPQGWAREWNGRPVMPEDVEQAWMSEIERRRADYKAGRVQLVDGEEVIRKAMSKYA